MADVLLGSERRVLIGGYGLQQPPAPESLLCRLDQIDLRLRQLEEQRAAHGCDDDVVRSRAQHQHTKSLPSALQQHVQLRGTLMDRLNLLESRIKQLSCELDLDAAGGKAAAGTTTYAAAAALGTMMAGSSSSSVPEAEDRELAPVLEPCRDPPPMMMMMKSSAAADGSWSAVERGAARQLHRNKPNPSNKVKSTKEAKCACQKEKENEKEKEKEKGRKKKPERSRTHRRWFGVGC